MSVHRIARRAARLAPAAALAGLLAGALAAGPPPEPAQAGTSAPSPRERLRAAPVWDALLPDGRVTRPLAELAASGSLAPGEDFRLRELGRDAHTSHHLVWIRDREVPHRHDRHDLWVVMLRGHGHMRLGDTERPVGEGSILYVPRGTPHAFRNASAEPAVAYAVYAPPFDGTDRQLLEPDPTPGP